MDNRETERTVCVQKRGEHFRANQRVYVDPETGCASDVDQHVSNEPDGTTGANRVVNHPLIGLCAVDAARSAFTVDVRIPIPEPRDLRVVQCLDTGRREADGRPIVRPFLVNRRFNATDDPVADRHPVDMMIARDKQAASAAPVPATPEPAEPESPASAKRKTSN